MGQTRAASISFRTDVDMYAFAARAAQRLSFDSGGSAGPYLRLFDASGRQLSAGIGGVAFTFAAAGTYYLGVSAQANRDYDPLTGAGDSRGWTGRYLLRMRAGTVRTGQAARPGVLFSNDEEKPWDDFNMLAH